MTVTHAVNGLRLSLPGSLPLDGAPGQLTVVETATGFDVALGAHTRRRVRIEASVRLGPARVPPGDWPGTREVGGRRIYYRIDRAEGGSGGEQIDFYAWETCANGHLHYAQSDLAEQPTEADFSLVWTLIAGIQPPSG